MRTLACRDTRASHLAAGLTPSSPLALRTGLTTGVPLSLGPQRWCKRLQACAGYMPVSSISIRTGATGCDVTRRMKIVTKCIVYHQVLQNATGFVESRTRRRTVIVLNTIEIR